jgi:hypothetical protein
MGDAPADPPPLISYALSSGHESVTKHVSRDLPGGPSSLVGTAVAGCVFVLMIGGGGLGPSLGLLGALLGAGLVAWWRARARRREAARAGALPALPARPDPRARVGCVGSVGAQAELALLGEITPRFFEPYTCWSPAAGLPGREVTRTRWALAAAAGVVCVAALWASGWGGWWFWLWSFVGATAGLAAGAMWPTYRWVVPGRLDVMRFGALGRRVVNVTSHDLRGNAVLVDLDQGCVFTADREGRTAEVGFASAWRPVEVAHAVLLAAVSESPAPELPDDALVG